MKFFLFILLAFLVSCMEPEIYKGGSKWMFYVKHSNRKNVDTIEFKSFDERLENYQIKSVWKISFKIDSGNIGKKIVKSTTGIVERHSFNFFSISSTVPISM